MAIQALLKRDTYYDSITLMTVAQFMRSLPGVEDAAAIMATPQNLALLYSSALLPPAFMAHQEPSAHADDLILSVRATTDQQATDALAATQEHLTTRGQESTQERVEEMPVRSLEAALRRASFSPKLAMISVAGEHAWLEAEQALQHNLHVFLFSDNVPLAQEQRLKQLAKEKGLLLMGPDCGTALINGIGLGFSNVVRRGSIGIVGASGTGIQQLSCLIDAAGLGISQAIGTGGRDLSEAIGGTMTRHALSLLAEDPATEVIVLVSKPPRPAVAQDVLAVAAEIGKPVIAVFPGSPPQAFSLPSNTVTLTSTLTEAAIQAVKLAGGPTERIPALQALQQQQARLLEARAQLAPEQRYVRALYSGGTLCDEAMYLLSGFVGPLASNIPLASGEVVATATSFEGHIALDLGDDEFTQGRPHPMIDPSLRLHYLKEAAADPATAVLLLDIVLGFCSHPDPAAIYAPVIQQIRTEKSTLPIIISLCGTEQDPQVLSRQRAALMAAGALVFESNAMAALATASIVCEERLLPTIFQHQMENQAV